MDIHADSRDQSLFQVAEPSRLDHAGIEVQHVGKGPCRFPVGTWMGRIPIDLSARSRREPSRLHFVVDLNSYEMEEYRKIAMVHGKGQDVLTEVDAVGSAAERRLWEFHAECLRMLPNELARGIFGVVTGPSRGCK